MDTCKEEKKARKGKGRKLKSFFKKVIRETRVVKEDSDKLTIQRVTFVGKSTLDKLIEEPRKTGVPTAWIDIPRDANELAIAIVGVATLGITKILIDLDGASWSRAAINQGKVQMAMNSAAVTHPLLTCQTTRTKSARTKRECVVQHLSSKSCLLWPEGTKPTPLKTQVMSLDQFLNSNNSSGDSPAASTSE
jgi:hypothetical protein